MGELDLRTAALGVGALTAGYLVGRRLLGSGVPSSDGLRERAGEALPGDGVDVPIGGTGGDDEEDAASEQDPTGADVGGAADPSLEEVDERTDQPGDGDSGTTAGGVEVESDVEETPAEPGEMQVDEDVVEEATDDETEEE